jgi:uncharacterized membrane protein YphA (DoxX/SURF4 family)
VVALVALRVGIGLHFSVEGVNKFIDPKPFSEPFLRGSKGPLTPLFVGFVWDADGLARLDREKTINVWSHYRERTVKRYGLDAKQAEATQRRREDQLNWHLKTAADDIDEYRKGLKRRDDYRTQQKRQQVASLRGQLETIGGELTYKRQELLGPINKIWEGYEADLNALVEAKLERNVALTLPKVGRRFMDSITIDVIIRYFDVAVGVCLICGLFTRLASLAGAGFLFSICLSQWPWAPGAMPVWYQLIEMLGMLVLAAIGAGSYAGFDYFLGPLWRKCCPPKQGSST